MIENRSSDVLIQDSWQALPEQVRDELLTRRVALTAPGAFPYQDLSKRWIPLRPLILDEPAYHLLEAVVARVLTLAVQSCQRRASTLGELHQALRFRDELPLMDPDGPLVASELTACARPDILIE
jgi:hypothetical protein